MGGSAVQPTFRSNAVAGVFKAGVQCGQPDDREFTNLHNIWLGNDKAGCGWFAENCKGWLINSKKPRVTLKSHRGTSVIRYYIVNEPSEVAAPLAFTLGLHPTPVKPFFKNWRAIRPQGWAWSPPPTNLYMTWARFGCRAHVPAPRNWKVLEDMVAHARENKQTVYPYLDALYHLDVRHGETRHALPAARHEAPEGAYLTKAKDPRKIEAYWYYAEHWNLSPPQFNSDGSGSGDLANGLRQSQQHVGRLFRRRRGGDPAPQQCRWLLL